MAVIMSLYEWFDAIQRGNIDAVAKYLSFDRTIINVSNARENTALHIAAMHNHIEIAALLIKNGANVNAVNEFLNTPLHIAAKFDYIKLASLLIRHGADVNAMDEFLITPLHIATGRNCYKTLELLLNSDANINAMSTSLETPLHYAIYATYANRFSILLVLLENGANIDARVIQGLNPLDIVTRLGYVGAIKLLIQHNVSLFDQFNNRRSSIERMKSHRNEQVRKIAEAILR